MARNRITLKLFNKTYMKTQTITIEVPNGYNASFDQAAGVITLKEKPKNVMERIKTVQDVLADNGISQGSFHKQCEGLETDELAYRLLKLLAKSLNEGWTPDWNDDNQYKYFAWFYMGGSSGFRYDGCGGWYSVSTVGSRLCFKSRELAEYAGKQFTQVFKDFMLIQ